VLNAYKNNIFQRVPVTGSPLVQGGGRAICKSKPRYIGLPTKRRNEMNATLRPLMAAAAIAMLFGTPALAANHSQRQVRSPQAPNAASHSVTAPDGQVIGADPDPGVRFELRRDAPYYPGDY
jgi:hypothetical protein